MLLGHVREALVNLSCLLTMATIDSKPEPDTMAKNYITPEARDGSELDSIIKNNMPDLEPFQRIYKDIHQHPELGEHEARTAAIASEHLERLGFSVSRNIGGHGTVGVLTNGEGPTILLCADMDALPILENTSLPYASTVRFKDQDGKESPVMHACGHDMHVTCLMAAAELLVNAKSTWSGVLICLFQPNEENGAGAMAMVEDGLYSKIPKPDLILVQHLTNGRTGDIFIRSGPCETAADSFLITIKGHGGHSSRPESCIDPIVIGSYVVVRLQSIVSRTVAPSDTVVVTCGSFHGGDAHNIIPDSVQLKLNIRTYDERVRAEVLRVMRDIVEAECKAAGAQEKPTILQTHKYPLTSNDPAIADKLRNVFQDHFGDEHVKEMEKLAGSEDFANLALPHHTPYSIWFIGSTNAEKYDDAVKKEQLDKIPNVHTDKFAPDVLPTLITGTKALSLATLNYLIVAANED